MGHIVYTIYMHASTLQKHASTPVIVCVRYISVSVLYIDFGLQRVYYCYNGEYGSTILLVVN